MKDQKIIIKKVKKVSGKGIHGGSWKVAYADFVTAMMAFFLLLWLISMVAPEKRARVSEYFKNFSIFTSSGQSMMLQNSSQIFNESGQTSDKALADLYGEAGSTSADRFRDILKKAVETQLRDLQDQISVTVIGDGVRIELTDKNGSSMFSMGSSMLTDQAKKILTVLSRSVRETDNKIYIEGHTDSYSYSSSSSYSNWELSSDRANAARRQLVESGVNPERIVRVVGFADKDPLIKDNPSDPRNRRISIIFKFPEKEDKKAPSVDFY
jgi:chemotaxis protein MotB